MKKLAVVGWILSALPALLLAFSATMKLTKHASVIEGFKKLQLPEHLMPAIGLLEIGCTVVYLIPLTSVLGAILLTGYLGGAVLTHLRVGDPSFFMPAIIGAVAWGGLYLREPRLRVLIPFRRRGGEGGP